MRTRHITAVVTAGLIAAGALLTRYQAYADIGGKPDDAAAEMVAAAENALRATMAANEAGRATIEDIYQWSLRLMNAEKGAGKADAAADHLKRMDNLHQKADLLYQAKAKGSSVNKVYATQFYFLEAKAMAEKK
jgi:hypothetical protein